MRYEIKRLLPRHHKMVELMLQGWSRKDIAGEMKMTPRAISLISGSSIFQDELSRRRRERHRAMDQALEVSTVRAQAVFARKARDAVDVQIKLLQADNPRVRLAASKAILDRSGIDEIRSQGPEGLVLTAEQAGRLRVALEEAGQL